MKERMREKRLSDISPEKEREVRVRVKINDLVSQEFVVIFHSYFCYLCF